MDKNIIDAGLIIKYLLNDNKEQYLVARGFFDLVKLGKIKAYLEQTVFSNSVITLETTYKVPRSKIAQSLIGMLEYKGIYNNEKEVLVESLNLYKYSNLYIADCIVLAKGKLHRLKVQSFNPELVEASTITSLNATEKIAE